MNSIFVEFRKDHFIRSELIKGFFKKTEVVGFSYGKESPIIKHEEYFFFVIEGEKEPVITTEECYNSYIELLRRNDKIKGVLNND